MRSTCLLLTLAALTLAVQSASSDLDTEAADWVLKAVCSNDSSTEDRPRCNSSNEEGKKTETTTVFSLNPTALDDTVDCTTRDNKNGICVLYYQCDSATNTIIDDGASILDLRLNVCPHYLEVCCKESQVSKVPDKSKEDSANRYNGEDSKTTPVAPTATPAPSRPSPAKGKSSRPEGCGWSNPGVAPKLRNAEVGETSPFAQYGDFPWMVALMKKTSDDDVWSDEDYLGGGTLIHPSVVITAAHKLSIKKKQFQASQLKCRAGEWDTQTTFELFPHQERDVAKYIIHENYYRISLLNDVALLIMKTPFDLMNDADHMGTGCLATSLPPHNYTCYSMGWGKDFNKKEKTLPSVLKKVQLKFVEHKTCEKQLMETRLGVEQFELHESLTCAKGEPGVDVCRGDGGSPLVCPLSKNPGERRYAVYGMVCYGIGGCGNPEIPGLYVNIPHLKSWVDGKMQAEGFGTSSYTI